MGIFNSTPNENRSQLMRQLSVYKRMVVGFTVPQPPEGHESGKLYLPTSFLVLYRMFFLSGESNLISDLKNVLEYR